MWLKEVSSRAEGVVSTAEDCPQAALQVRQLQLLGTPRRRYPRTIIGAFREAM
jgi:hypothetical protein